MTDEEDTSAAVPRPLALVIVAALAAAVVAALVGPNFRAAPSGEALTVAPSDGPTGVGVIRRQLEGSEGGARIGAAVPDFEWNAPEGTTLRLAALRGKTLVVNFWATWCVPCRKEMPALDRLAQRDPDLVVLGVNLQEDGASVRAFFDRYQLVAIRPLLDIDASTARNYSVLSLPTTFFIDHAGVIRHVAIGGPLSEEELQAAISKARR